MARKWYAVYVGHVPGVYDEWPECKAQVSGFSAEARKGLLAERKPKLVT